MSCKMLIEVTDLPDPDSPTSALISPLQTLKFSYFTAVKLVFSFSKATVRSLICNKGAPIVL